MNKFIAGLVIGLIALTPAVAAPTATAASLSSIAAAAPQVSLQVPSTTSREQAIRKAKSYLAYTSFSRKGLIKQLKFEGFSTGDSTRAVDSLRVNWNKQAAKKAKSYLRYTAFSRKGLISQLKFEGFTTNQAKYGVRAVGL